MDATPPALRLFVFHHAGGSHVPYRQWPELLPAQWDVRLLDAPGRGRLGDLPQFDDAGRLADFFLRRLHDELEGPYAFFGHSMGALVAYEMTVRLAARGRALPLWLGLSARGAPGPAAAPGRHHHHLPDAELQAHLELLGGTPDEVFDDPGLWALYEPLIRGDMRLVETWQPNPRTPALPVPLSVFGGSEDTSVPPRRLAGWEQRTDRFLGLRVLDGGHFYFLEDPRPLLERIRQDVARAAAVHAGPART
ncbi:thioesterase II family protein [Streptomyces sp. NPDC050658]|uniref:thioesterase II family protein n=1 Tax=unclassified Streptomyces TaxID=2593676 RepID=UPI00341B52B6